MRQLLLTVSYVFKSPITCLPCERVCLLICRLTNFLVSSSYQTKLTEGKGSANNELEVGKRRCCLYFPFRWVNSASALVLCASRLIEMFVASVMILQGKVTKVVS